MAAQSSSFGLLHRTVQEWVWHRNWSELRDAQEQAIPIVLAGESDLIISAATAAGKTEAAFLPIASMLVEAQGAGLALYVSPLKALINDQCSRLEDLFGNCHLPVYPWHGDIAGTRKTQFEKNPKGALLITPESLESIFVRRGFYIGKIFEFLKVVVVDELHSFINTERGVQLASLLCRLEVALGHRIPRIGLSATLGDMRLAADYLRPGESEATAIIESSATGQELKLLLKGYVEPVFKGPAGEDVDPESEMGSASIAIARDVFRACRGSKNLAFANSRRRVEEFTDRLSALCEEAALPVEFHAHHGSLSKSLREEVEAILKEENRPATAVCTSTLEMGIDIGQVKSIIQLDPPFSVSSLRQRMGRSGRRGEPAILRMFVAEPELRSDLAPQDSLRLDLLQAVAVTNLLLEKWCEPPRRARLHLSTLIQQLLSLIAQYGGLTAKDAWRILCAQGPFRNVDQPMFVRLLRELGARNVLMRSPDGTLLHAPVGEQIVNHYSFYTAFQTSEEFKVVAGSTVLGTLPLTGPVAEKSLILFAGRRWRVVTVDDAAKIIEVVAAQGGRAPRFSGSAGLVHPRIHEEMYWLLCHRETPRFLDQQAAALLQEARGQFKRNQLHQQSILPHNGDCLVFLWAGDLVAGTLLVQLQALGFVGCSFGVGLVIENTTPDELRACLRSLAESGLHDTAVLASTVANRHVDRYDTLLPDDLLSENHASASLDTAGAISTLRHLLPR